MDDTKVFFSFLFLRRKNSFKHEQKEAVKVFGTL